MINQKKIFDWFCNNGYPSPVQSELNDLCDIIASTIKPTEPVAGMKSAEYWMELYPINPLRSKSDEQEVIDFIRAIQADTIAAHEKPGWQSIETAPRDGTEILGAWFRDGKMKAAGVVDFHSLEWHEGCDPIGEPSDWMPLPVAPKPEKLK